MGQYQRLDPAVARVIETLADLMAERDFHGRGARLTDAHHPLRPLFERPAERPFDR